MKGKAKTTLLSLMQLTFLFSNFLFYTNISSNGLAKANVQLSQSSPNKIFNLSFEEIAENQVNDDITGLSGTIRGGVLDEGIIGNGIKFSTQTDRIGFPDNPIFDFVANDFTILIWVRINTMEETGNIINLMSHGDGGGNSKKWFLSLNKAGNSDIYSPALHAWDQNQIQDLYFGGSPIEFRHYNWQFIALTKLEHTLTLFVNGTNVGVTTWNYEIGQSSEELSIGYSEPPDANAIAVDGNMDEISIYDIAFSNIQVSNSFTDTLNHNKGVETSTKLVFNLSPSLLNILFTGFFGLITGVVGFYIGKSRIPSKKHSET